MPRRMKQINYAKVTHKEPMSHQQEIAECELDAIYDESATGTGKSINLLNFFNTRGHNSNPHFSLVIAVKAALTQFSIEVLSIKAGIPFIITRKNQPKIEMLRSYKDAGINIVLISNKEIMNHAPSVQYIQEVVDLYGYNHSCLGLDEAHQYRKANRHASSNGTGDFKTLAVKSAVQVSSMFKYKYLSSATPYDKSVEERWVTYHILYPYLFADYYKFKYKYTKIDNCTGARINNPIYMNELRELTKAFTFKFSLDDIRDDVPEQTVTIVRVQAPREVEDLGTLIRATVGEEQPITVPARLGAHGQVITARKDTLYIDHHFSLDSTLRRLGSVHGGKKERLYDMYPNPTKESPLLVLCAFKDTALEIAEHYGVQAYCGGIQLTDEIQYGKVLVGTISALKQSISLEHISEGVLLTPDWSSITLRQILGRMRRLTSQYDINLTIMVSSVAIDPRVWRVVDNKLKGIELYDSMVNKTKDLAEEQTVEVRKQMLANRLTNAVNKIVAKLPIGDVLVKYDNAQSLGVLKRALFIYRKDSGMPHYIHRINFVCLDDMQAWGMRAKEMKYKVVATLTVKELV